MSLRDAGVMLIDCVHATPPAKARGYPYVAIPQMKNGRIDFESARRISQSDFTEWTKKARPQLHDVVLSRRTNPGVTATFDDQVEFALGQNLVLLRADGTHVLPEFLRWLVTGPFWWEQIEKFNNVGAIFDSLRCADVPRFELPIPPKPTQHAIASVLKALDDKIVINRSMCTTLEATVQSIYKDWFIDFGPVRAKSLGGNSYLTGSVWSLFANSFDESGLPLGWATSSIGQEVEVFGGSTPSTKEVKYWGGDIAWATPKDLSSLSTPVLLSTERQITELGLSQISSGLLPTGTVLLSSRAPIGYLAITDVPVAVNQGFIAMVCKGRLSNVFVWQWVQASLEQVHRRANGSTFQEISKANFRPITVTVGTPEIHVAFDALVKPMFERISANEREIRALATTRDFLLPRLMSGEITVKDAEKSVGELT
ncbi:restriction endonuclease subunit S [Stenotrophomonas lactitubi]|uniref:restriction endonuclease subunit S n=1 Tax=Stenotrophomonas lactitubi TaxID=2045214 RepID=UPI001E3418A9|nr:restriction endonuclease subunit S [Stenotrophomonas lactitubi]